MNTVRCKVIVTYDHVIWSVLCDSSQAFHFGFEVLSRESPLHLYTFALQEVFQFLLSNEAKDLRPLLVSQLVSGLDLLLRDRIRKLYTITLPTLTPRLPFFGERGRKLF